LCQFYSLKEQSDDTLYTNDLAISQPKTKFEISDTLIFHFTSKSKKLFGHYKYREEGGIFNVAKNTSILLFQQASIIKKFLLKIRRKHSHFTALFNLVFPP
jgi:hypothetical protein